jgi:hypothetical protein
VERCRQEGADVDTPTHLEALVSAGRADDCRAALLAHLDSDEVRTTPAPPGRYTVRDDRLFDDATAARHGAVRAAALGVVAGGFVAIITAGTGGVPWPLFVAGGGVFAGLVGAVVGLQRHEVLDDDPVSSVQVGPDEGWWLAIVDSHHRATSAHRILVRHGAVFVERDGSRAVP